MDDVADTNIAKRGTYYHDAEVELSVIGGGITAAVELANVDGGLYHNVWVYYSTQKWCAEFWQGQQSAPRFWIFIAKLVSLRDCLLLLPSHCGDNPQTNSPTATPTFAST